MTEKIGGLVGWGVFLIPWVIWCLFLVSTSVKTNYLKKKSPKPLL